MNALDLIERDGPYVDLANFYLHPICVTCGVDLNAPPARELPRVPYCRRHSGYMKGWKWPSARLLQKVLDRGNAG